ncbi:GTP 3',8-cyclase MoaA [Gallaecimonas pentaromativorans]|uniref:GTP 3',8-cyclase n=1 Tax=Gallaecimonas pentaromativorans TaxID=584787 RepID=A0A3N1PII9_9GAMM|nr:GTP 3',8-cyclase MoaA [Gallaecimonas pentaromativorans]ROQ27648.1 cyclic pyranopterin monophosphate synthase subunit MoaA [Gallaecimonas pentaromativorans]
MLQDKFGRRFHYLRLSITDVCNFRCSYCLPDGYQCDSPRDFLELDEITTVVKAFAGLGTSKIRITGGEPSLRKDLPEIIKTCAGTEGIKEVAVTTNGYKLPQMIDAWAEAGLTNLNVSIDSLDPRQFKAITGHDKLQTILQGVDRALALGLKVKINSVLLKPYSEALLGTALDWLKEVPVSLRLIELMQTGDNHDFFNANHVSGLPIKEQLLALGWQQAERKVTAGPAQEFSHPDYAGRIGLIMPYSKDFCSSCNRLRVSATGNLHLCLFAEQGLPLRPLLKEGDVAALQARLQSLMGKKEATHWLHEGFTGATKQLAMLGG